MPQLGYWRNRNINVELSAKQPQPAPQPQVQPPVSITPEMAPANATPAANAQVVAQNVSVTCPVGSKAGDSIQITHEGQLYDLTVPNGVAEGQQFLAQLQQFQAPPIPPLPPCDSTSAA